MAALGDTRVMVRKARKSSPAGTGAAATTATTSRVPQADLVQLFNLFNAGRHAEMEATAAALAWRHPDDGQAWKAWGIALLAQRKDALAALQRAAVLLPADAELPSNLGGLYVAQGRLDDAAACYRRALALQPGFAATHSKLGDVLGRQGHWAEAAGHLRQALALQPGTALLHFQLGNLLADLGRPVDAAASLRQALALRPDFPEAQANLGLALGAAGQLDEAVAALQEVVGQRPADALQHSNLGNALLAAGRIDDAVARQQQAVALAPGLARVHGNLGHALKAAGRPEAALPALRQALALAPDELARHSALLFTQQYAPPASAARRRVDAERFGAAARRALGNARCFSDWPLALAAGSAGGLRVGLLSADLRQHPVGFFLESVLAALAQRPATPGGGKLTLHVYDNHAANPPPGDAVSQRLRAHCQCWRPVHGLDDAGLAALIRADGIQVLIDLAGHTLGNRLAVLARRPAPVQVSWLGYCASTGLAEVDAAIVDPWIAPPGAEAAFVEPLLRLPETFLCFTPPDLALPVGPLPALTGGGVRFGCFNHLAKLNDAVLALWSRILLALPASTLVLQSAGLQDPALRQQLLGRFAGLGIAAARLQLQAAMPRTDYLAAIGQVDIVLDPFPYPGGTTTLEALWMGVPVLSLPGATALSRQGLSILQNLGLPDWVAADEADYLALAQRHAGNLAALAALRQGLRQRLLASPLCDAPRFAGHLEAALRGLWLGRPGSAV